MAYGTGLSVYNLDLIFKPQSSHHGLPPPRCNQNNFPKFSCLKHNYGSFASQAAFRNSL